MHEVPQVRARAATLDPISPTWALRSIWREFARACSTPTSDLPRDSISVTVTLADGTRIEGVAKNYSNYALQILDAQGRLHFLANNEAAAIEFLDDSWMPADYSQRLNGEEIQDILAFLSSLSLSYEPKPSRGASQ